MHCPNASVSYATNSLVLDKPIVARVPF
jgi:hypothetical protein